MSEREMDGAKAIAAELGIADDSGTGCLSTGEGEGQDAVRNDRIQTLTEEIREYKKTAGDAILEIGCRLKEAKSLLPHGEWLPWLNEKAEFSERTAQNFMRLADAYANPQTLADLGASKALQLLALNPVEREEFLSEKHEVNGDEKSVRDMSSRELDKALKERDEAVKAKELAEEKLKGQLDEQKKTYDADMQAEHAKVQALTTKSNGLQEKLKAAREKEKETRTAADAAQKELKDLKEKPVDVAVQEPDKEALDKLRRDAEAAAEEKVREANARLMQARADADAAAGEAEKYRKQLEMADRATMAFKFFFDEWQHKFNAMIGALQEVSDVEKAEKLKTAVRAAAEKMKGLLDGGKEAI